MENTETVNDNTSVEANETANDAAPQEELDSVIDNMTLDDLMDLSAEDYPEFGEENHTGMKPLHHWMAHVPEDVRKHIANLRSDYTRKSQEIAQIRKDLETSRSELRRQSENMVNGPLAQKLNNIDEETEYDLFDPEGMKAEIQRQAQLMLKQMLKPEQEKLEVEQRKLQLEQFKLENPELQDPEYRAPIIELLQKRPELKLEDAFYIVKSKIGATKLQQERAELAERKSRQRDMARLSTRGSKAKVAGQPKFKNAVEAYKWHKSQLGK